MTKQNRNTFLFFGFLLLGGICNLLTRTLISVVDTFMFSANFLIYIGLLIFWMHSVKTRLLPTKARSYILASASLSIFYLLVRVLRFRILTEVIVRRYVDYLYNIAPVLSSTLFLMTCIRIHRGDGDERNGKERLLLVPACTLLVLILTNDLHQLFYRRLIPLSEFHGVVGTYTYGPLFYLMYGWMVAALLTGFVFLILKTRRQSFRVLFHFAAVVLIWGSVNLINLLVFTPLDLVRLFHAPEINVFGMLGFFEVCIRNRLIPYNENYTGFFANLGLPVRITDDAFASVYETNLPICASEQELSASVAAPVYPDEDTRLSGMKIRPGYVFWTEDESELHRESLRLESANEILSEENALIAVENELKEKKAHLDAQDRIYNKIAAALYHKQQRIDRLLESTPPSSENFEKTLAECCVLNAYCKRKSNLLLLTNENMSLPSRELFLALQESARYLNCCGIPAAATGEEYSDLPLDSVNAVYDCFETLIEALLPQIQGMTVSLAAGGIRIAMEADCDPELPKTALPVTCLKSDGCYFLTVHAEGGEGK
ncbi:MAG: hypothetical protein IK132_12345 [Clostridia bacterium]|nr:hypothetical protein [Clostridia bacterium]